MSVSSWLVGLSQPRHQPRVIESLSSVGAKSFCPRVRRTYVSAGRRIDLLVPAFGRYFFVQWTPDWRNLLGVRNLEGFLKNSDAEESPSVVRNSSIQPILEQCDESGVLFESSAPQLNKLRRGQKVKPRSGAMIDLFGSYAGCQRNREHAFFVLMGRETKVTFVKGTLIAA